MAEEPRRTRTLRLRILVVVLVSLGAAIWLFVPDPFVRGLLLGASIVPAAGLGALAIFARRMRSRLADQLEAPPLPVETWDLDMRVQDLDGRPVEFTGIAGRVLVLNVWATWCAPCVAELPSIARLHEATSDVGVVVACVSAEPASVVKTFLAKHPTQAPIYLLEGELPDVLETRAIPATFVVDRSGSIALRHVGAAAWDSPEVVRFVRSLALAPPL